MAIEIMRELAHRVEDTNQKLRAATANKAGLTVAGMSRLDSFIARMQAQRDCLNFLEAGRRRPARADPRSGLWATAAPTTICAISFPAATSTCSSARWRPIPTASRPTTGCSWARRASRFRAPRDSSAPRAALIHTDLGTGDHAGQHGDGQVAGPGARRAGRVAAATCSPTSRSRWRAGGACPSRPACRTGGISCIGSPDSVSSSPLLLFLSPLGRRRRKGDGEAFKRQRLNSRSSTSSTTAPITEPTKPAGSPY